MTQSSNMPNISIESGPIMFLSDFRYETGVKVILILRHNELHFILLPYEGDNVHVVPKGLESSTFFAVLRCFYKHVDGKEIKDIYFYAIYDEAWSQFQFDNLDINLIMDPSLESEDDIPLDPPIINDMDVDKLLDKRLKNDSDADAFAYWYHKMESANYLSGHYFDELYDAKKPLTIEKSFGDLKYNVREFRCVTFLFSTTKSALNKKIRELQTNHKVVYITPVIRGRWQGWVCGAVVVDEIENYWTLLEPGKHVLRPYEFNEYLEKLSAVGAGIKYQNNDSIAIVDNPIDIDFSKPSGHVAMALKGKYIFEKGPEDELIF